MNQSRFEHLSKHMLMFNAMTFDSNIAFCIFVLGMHLTTAHNVKGDAGSSHRGIITNSAAPHCSTDLLLITVHER